MEKKILKNKPLVEAIFELRWKLPQTSEEEIIPRYKILIGMLYERVKDKYPYYEQLPTVNIPDEIARYIVQYRFRVDKDKWPLIQIGPGVVTLNDTENYVWEDFKVRIYDIINYIYDIYSNLKITFEANELLLRYIDAVNFDYENDDLFEFLRDKLKVNIMINESLFENTGVKNCPLDVDLRFSFPSTNPKGAILLRFARGKIKDSDSLIWETMVKTKKGDFLNNKENIEEWVEKAHSLTHDWFFKMIEGELSRRFE